MEIVEIKTVKELKDLIKNLPDDSPVGTYYANYWHPILDQSCKMAVLPDGLAVNIDYSHNY